MVAPADPPATANKPLEGLDALVLPQLFEPHPMREQLYEELHARPFPVVSAPVRVSHLTLLLDDDDARAREFDHLLALCRRYGVNPPPAHANSYQQDLGEFEVRWERHVEFSSYTFFRSGNGDEPFKQTALALLPQDWLAELPGQLVTGLHVEMFGADSEELSRDEMRDCFEGQRLVSGRVANGNATVWSAFRLHGDGFNRFLVYNKGLNPNQTGRLLQRLLELETYRLMALLALPQAKELSPKLSRMDQKLAAIIGLISKLDGQQEEWRLLHELSGLAAELERYRSQYNYRFSATRAYYELVMRRLDELREQQVHNYFTIASFLSRRLTPAYKTCESVNGRLDDLSRRIKRAGDLLRTRVDLTIESQNQRLLSSMNRRGRLQLRLQETVEGLSIAAISYYAVGLFKYLLGILDGVGLKVDKELITGLSVPVIVALVWWVTHRVKRFIMDSSDPKREDDG